MLLPSSFWFGIKRRGSKTSRLSARARSAFLLPRAKILRRHGLDSRRRSARAHLPHEMASQLVNHLLSHNLATNDNVLESIAHVRSVLHDQRAIQKCEADEGLGGPVINRSAAFEPSSALASEERGLRIGGRR